eukprot:jgi/Psemu1/46990/gm1.46990_g
MGTKNTIKDSPFVPRDVKEVVMAADAIHVNQVPMLATISRGIHYNAIAALPSMKLKELEGALMSVFRASSLRSIRIISLLVNIQFKGLANNLAKSEVMVNVVSKEEHVPEIKHFIQVIKERARASYAMLPVVPLLSTVVFYLNAFPWPEGMYQELSPTTIVKGRVLSFQTDSQVIFGEYTQTYEGTDSTMRPQTFFSLQSGEYLDRSKNDYTLLLMPAEAIKQLERMARRSRSGLIFRDRNNNGAEDLGSDEDEDEDDEEYLPSTSKHNVTLEDTSSSEEDYDLDDKNTDTEGSNDDSNENSKDDEAQSEREDSKDEASEGDKMGATTGVENVYFFSRH